MTCETVREAMCEYLDDLLDVTEKQRVDTHLADCHQCREEMGELRATLTWVKQADVITPPQDLRQSVLRELSRQQQRRPWYRIPGLFQAVAAVAVMVLLIAGNMLPDQSAFLMREVTSFGVTDDAAMESDGLSGAPQDDMQIQTNSLDHDANVAENSFDSDEGNRLLVDSDSRGSGIPWRLVLNLALAPLFILLTWLFVKKRREASP